jgi:hypothetical protein
MPERPSQRHTSRLVSLDVIQKQTSSKLTDPFADKPLDYYKLNDGFAISSVGGIGREGEKPKVFRLWDVANRRQSASPKPPVHKP